MTILEFAEKTSLVPLMEWQREYFQMYEEALKTGKRLTVSFPPRSGRQHTINIINQFYGKEMKDVYCQGTKKNGIPCKRYLGKVEGKAELLCPICKTVNVVEDGKITIKNRCVNREIIQKL